MGGAGGTEYYALVLTNTGSSPCTTGGYPGVSLLNAARQPIGPPATRAQGSPQRALVVAPGQAVSSELTAQPNLCNGGVNVQRSAYVGVFPPNQTQQLVFPAAVVACQNTIFTLEAGSSPQQR